MNPLVWPMGMKLAGVGVLIAGTTAGVVTTQVTGNTAEPGVMSYLCEFTNGDMLLQWNASGGLIDGTYENAQPTGSAPSETVNTAQGVLTGTINGSGITLHLADFGTTTWYGTVSGPSVTLNVPQQNGSIQPTTCDSSGVNNWNKTMSGLNSGVDAANNDALEQQARASTSAAISQAQQQLSSDVTTLENDTNSLNTNKQLGTDVDQMKTDYGTEQNDYQTEVSQGSCSDGSLGSDAAQVSSDSSQVDSDYDQLQSDVQSLQGSDGTGEIQSDVSTVNSDLTTLQNLGATPALSTSAALAGGTKAIGSANSAIQWADGQGKAIDGEADQLATTAGNYESSRGC